MRLNSTHVQWIQGFHAYTHIANHVLGTVTVFCFEKTTSNYLRFPFGRFGCTNKKILHKKVYKENPSQRQLQRFSIIKGLHVRRPKGGLRPKIKDHLSVLRPYGLMVMTLACEEGGHGFDPQYSNSSKNHFAT